MITNNYIHNTPKLQNFTKIKQKKIKLTKMYQFFTTCVEMRPIESESEK